LVGHDDHLVSSFDFRSHVGEPEQHSLIVCDGLAERPSLLPIPYGEFERTQCQSAAARSDVDAPDLDAVHHLVETAAGRAAKNRLGCNPIAVEEHLGGVDAFVPHLLDLARYGQAGRDLAETGWLLDQQRGHVSEGASSSVLTSTATRFAVAPFVSYIFWPSTR
jgi:hypothetical protein